MLVVSDIMTRSVVTLSPGTRVREAATTLSSMGITGAPVCDEKGVLVGVFSKSDIAARLADGGSSETATVGELMTAIVFSVRPTDPLKTAIWLMVFESVHRLMVTDETKQLIGIVTPMDVCKAIVEGKLAARELAGPQGGSQ